MQVPKRLQGSIITLTAKFQKLQSQCPYHMLLSYYCPIFVRLLLILHLNTIFLTFHKWDPKPAALTGQSSLGVPARTDILNDLMVTANTNVLPRTKLSSTEHASSVGEVSAFVLGVIKRVIPRTFFGGDENQKSVMGSINRFIRLRRFESLSLHNVMQGLKVHTLCF